MMPSLARRDFVERQATVNGVRLNCAERPDHGIPVVVIPGQSMPWESDQRVLPPLAERYHVVAVDVRGHGGSAHTPGAYTYATCGRDFAAFLREVVKAPAIVSGNSSGGVITVWLAACAPDVVRAICAEDPPLFSSEWPRMQREFAAKLFADVVKHTRDGRVDLAAFFRDFKVPSRNGVTVMKFPAPLAWLLRRALSRAQRRGDGGSVDLRWLPLHVRLFVGGLSEYDPDFTRACADGSFCDIDHAALRSRVRCPFTLLHAHWFRHETLGLVGAMDDDDVARVRRLASHVDVRRLPLQHVMHLAAPRTFVNVIDDLGSAASRTTMPTAAPTDAPTPSATSGAA